MGDKLRAFVRSLQRSARLHFGSKSLIFLHNPDQKSNIHTKCSDRTLALTRIASAQLINRSRSKLVGITDALGKDGEGVQRILNSLAILKDIALLGRPSIER